jgi:hypothetical protein
MHLVSLVLALQPVSQAVVRELPLVSLWRARDWMDRMTLALSLVSGQVPV